MRNALLPVALLGLLFLPAVAQPATAPVNPFGTWYGKFEDGSGSFTMVINADGTGGFVVSDAQGQVLRGASGYWSFLDNSTGGVLTLTYYHFGWSKFHFGITYVNARSLVLSDYITANGVPIRVVLHRQ